MFYQVFFITCLIGVVLVSITFDCRFKALLTGCAGFAIGYLAEVNGVTGGEWDYATVDSLFLVSRVPIEILFGYFSALFFAVVLVVHIPDLSTEERRTFILRYATLLVGVGFLTFAYIFDTMSITVGWAFMGVFGLSVAPDRTIPLAVGLSAFMCDWVVEGTLTGHVSYYANGWNPSIARVFMFAGFFVAGVLTSREVIIDDLSLGAWSREAS